MDHVLYCRQVVGVLIVFQVVSVGRLCLANVITGNFVFGDSLVDAGNNNYLITLSRANYAPNGIDFGKPTGRFTNGRTIIDIIEQELGLGEYSPPYLAPTTKGPVILQGVNYASGGGGILNQTGKVFGGRLNLGAQIDNFARTRQDIIARIGEPAALNLFKTSLFSVTIGSNDFINNYLTPGVPSAIQTRVKPIVPFIQAMISQLRSQLTRLYDMGARKFFIPNVAPLGCIPYIRDTNPAAGQSCVTLPNQLAEMYNFDLKNLVAELSTKFAGATIVYADIHRIVIDIMENYKSYGLDNANSACCYVSGNYGGLMPCGPVSKLCPDRSKFLFWDAYHPSEAANIIIARRLLDGDTNDIFPMNIRKLAAL